MSSDLAELDSYYRNSQEERPTAHPENSLSGVTADRQSTVSDVVGLQPPKQAPGFINSPSGTGDNSQPSQYVLFDAEQELGNGEFEDDFGDFETATPSVKSYTQLESNRDILSTQSINEGSQQASTEAKARLAKLAKFEPPLPDTTDHDEPWDDFQISSSSISTQVAAPIHTEEKPGALFDIDRSMAESDEMPPTNLPPPALLLSLFPSIFNESQNALLESIAPNPNQTTKMPQTRSATKHLLENHLLVARVAARIISGRKLRWKRDQSLSQGMKIGQASKKTTGMKLAAIDKAENIREEREVIDVLQAWRLQVGRLRSAVSAVNTEGQTRSITIPTLQEVMPLSIAKETDGAIPSSRPCSLCGLKRNERVKDVDVNVQDSFEEYWTTKLNMHRGKLMWSFKR